MKRHIRIVYMVPSRSWTNDLLGLEPTPIHWALFTFDCSNICILYHWNCGNFTTSENERNRRNTTKLVFPSLCPLKSRGEDFRTSFQMIHFCWILLVPKHSLLKYFTLTFTWHKSSKFEGSGPPFKFRQKFFWKWSFFDKKQQLLNNVEPFERILRALLIAQCPCKFSSFLDLRNGSSSLW